VPIGAIGCGSGMRTDALEQPRTAIQVSAMYGFFRSYLSLTNKTRPVLTQHNAIADFSWHFTNQASIGISAGSVIGGDFSYGDSTIALHAGPILSVEGSKILLKENRLIPFIASAMAISGSWTGTAAPGTSFLATDARISLVAGYTIKDRLQIYLSPKLFGGPFFRLTNGKAIRGNDRYFFQTGMGMALMLPKGYMLFVNGSPLGEQALGGGLSKIF
jgi:hypothetical protein